MAKTEKPEVSESHLGSRRSRVIVIGAGMVVVLIAFWSLLVVLRPAQDPTAGQDYVYATVTEGRVESTLSLNTVATWGLEPAGMNKATGTVTSIVVNPGDDVKAGSILYTVDLRPVVIASGTIPAFRSMTAGDKGEDVTQLQQLLNELGFRQGQATGQVDAATSASIKAWQKSIGVEPTGTVEPGDLVFVPTLPTRVSLDTDVISVGFALVGGERVVRVLSSEPDFYIAVTDSQATAMIVGTKVEITSTTGSKWQAVIQEVTTDSTTNALHAVLTGVDNASICGAECGSIPSTGKSFLASKIILVPSVSGLVVPSAALISDASGQLAVVDDSGNRIPVTVSASSQGMSVVEGVAEGTQVRVPVSASN